MKKKKQSKRKSTTKSNGTHLLNGKLEITRSGMGFVIVDQLEQDILIRPNDLNTAMHGDTVRVRITKPLGRGGRVQGVIEEVISRKQNVFMGKLEISKTFAFFIPDGDKPMPDIYIPLANINGAENGSRVIAKIVEWESGKKPTGEVVEILSVEAENDLAMK